MGKKVQTFASLAAAGALLAVPAVGQAHHRQGHDSGGNDGNRGATGRSCAKKPTVDKGFVVKGTLVSYTADNPATQNSNEQSLTVTLTRQNRHARRAGLTDVAGGTSGLQYRLNAADDAFGLRLSEFEPGETPAAGDRVHIVGKVAVTRKKCAAPNASLADRYGAVDVRKVKIVDNTD